VWPSCVEYRVSQPPGFPSYSTFEKNRMTFSCEIGKLCVCMPLLFQCNDSVRLQLYSKPQNKTLCTVNNYHNSHHYKFRIFVRRFKAKSRTYKLEFLSLTQNRLGLYQKFYLYIRCLLRCVF